MISQSTTHERGVALLEVLVAMLITAFGILGYVGLQARTAVANLEAYQRSQALVLVNDMAQRINLNRASAASYIGSSVGVTDPGTCSAMLGAARDLCEWAQSIRGAGEKQGGTAVGAMLNAQGCISQSTYAPTGSIHYVISIAWQGMRASGAPASDCGRNGFSSEDLRRTVSVVVQIANLNP